MIQFKMVPSVVWQGPKIKMLLKRVTHPRSSLLGGPGILGSKANVSPEKAPQPFIAACSRQ